MLLVQAALLVRQSAATGITVDEPAHLVSAFLYWHGRDVLLPRDMPPLMKVVAGPIPSGAVLGIDPAAVQPGEWEWDFANRVMHHDDPHWIGPEFYRVRLAMIVFPLLTTLLLFLWARSNLGPLPAFAAAFCFAFDPTSLGHGSLVKNDHAAACTYLLFCLAAFRYASLPSWPRLVCLAAALFLAVSAKLSLLICLPAALILLAVTLRSWRAVPQSLAMIGFLYAATCLASWFDLASLTPAEFQQSSVNRLIPQLSPLLEPLLTGLPVPRLYWNGVNALLYWNADSGNPIYLLGRHIPEGSPWFFLVCILVKVPEGFLLLFAAGLAAVLSSLRRAPRHRACFLLLPPALYVAAASLTSMQLGIRLILPALPFAALIAASVFAPPLPAWRRNAALAALAAAGLSAALAAPHWIGYFNHASGGPAHGLQYLAGSNLDWGQDLPALRAWMDRDKPPPVKLYYFGNDNPFRFFNDNEIEPQAPPWGPELVTSDRLSPVPGYYVISANLLPGHFFAPRFRDYFAAFRPLAPLAIAGTSLYIYRIP